jgi:hypothetical protein
MPRDRRYGGQTSIRDVDLYEGGYTPWERAGQVALSRTPEAFSYGSLEEKYPTRQVMPMVPSYIQNQLDEENLARKSNEVALRVREAQLNTYDSKLNEDRAIAEQVIQARPEFASLNPQDPDYQEKRDQLLIKYPMIEDSKEFMARTVGRLDRINERYINKIKPPSSADAYKDYEDAYKNMNALTASKDESEFTSEDEIYMSIQAQRMDAAKAKMGAVNQPIPKQQGIPEPSMPSTTSMPTTPQVKEGKVYKQDGKMYRYTNGQFIELP